MSYNAKVSVIVNTTADKVWEVITTPELITQFLFGTLVETDWNVGSSIKYKGVWEGKPYEDKGTILAFEPNKLFQSTYFSDISGKEDIPENYNTVSYILAEHDGKTELTLTQDNIPTRDEATHSEGNWKMVLEKIKEIAEHLN